MSAAKELRGWFFGAKRVVVIGVGNPLRRDDNVGVEVVRGLKEKVPRSVLLIESETVPESFTEPIIEHKPTHILIVDAALLGLEAGAGRLVEPRLVVGSAISTHALSVQLFCDYLAKMTGAKMGLLLVQPEDTDFGEGLSPKVEAAKKRLVKSLVQLLGGGEK